MKRISRNTSAILMRLRQVSITRGTLMMLEEKVGFVQFLMTLLFLLLFTGIWDSMTLLPCGLYKRLGVRFMLSNIWKNMVRALNTMLTKSIVALIDILHRNFHTMLTIMSCLRVGLVLIFWKNAALKISRLVRKLRMLLKIFMR